MLFHPRRKSAGFASDRSGNVSVIFGLSFLPMVLFVGAAIDYSQSAALKEKLQIATDSALLASAKDAHSGVNLAQLNTDIQQYLGALTPGAQVVGQPTVSSDQTAVCVSTQAFYQTTFMRIAGQDQITVGAYSCTKFNIDTFEIALVMDNSGSMADSALNGQTKMQATVTAANTLVTTMNQVASTGSISYSLVPFSAAVNIGTGYANASFMDTQGKSSIHWQNMIVSNKAFTATTWVPQSRFDLFNLMAAQLSSDGWGGCVEERPAPYTTSDTAAASSIPDTLFVPFLSPDENDSNNNALNDYLGDSGGSVCTTKSTDPYTVADKNNGRGDGQTKVCKYKSQKPSTGSSGLGSVAQGFGLGPNLNCTSQPLTTLTNNTTTITNSIKAMKAVGDTNLLAGVMWGWRTISPNGPFNTQPTSTSGPQNAKPYNYVSSSGAVNHKIIVLMTDGMNNWASASSDPNKGSYSSLGYYANNRLGSTTASNARSLMDAATLQACTNAKSAGLVIYTVGFTASDGIDSEGQSVLQNCATSPSYAFIAANGTQLQAAFQAIADSMSNLRLSN